MAYGERALTVDEVSAPNTKPFLDIWDGTVSIDRDVPLSEYDLPAIWDGTEWITKELVAKEYSFLGENTWEELTGHLIPLREKDLQSEEDDLLDNFFFGPYRSFRGMYIPAEPDPFTDDQFTEEF